jgi:hypothetical protein
MDEDNGTASLTYVRYDDTAWYFSFARKTVFITAVKTRFHGVEPSICIWARRRPLGHLATATIAYFYLLRWYFNFHSRSPLPAA